LLRNYLLVGAPVLTADLGHQVWIANNKDTFTHYPVESIDRSAAEAFAALNPAELRELESLSGNEIRESDWFMKKGADYIKTHPVATIQGAFRKVVAGFSWNFNQVGEPLVDATYLLSYGPISILGILGMVLSRSQWREHSLIYLLFVAFAVLSAVFWAHTSHRSHLDVYWIIFAAYLLTGLFEKRRLCIRTASR
jgi:hypothetical protein